MKLLKILGLTAGILAIVFTIAILGTYWWLSTKWTDFYTVEEMQAMAEQINQAATLSDNFYLAYEEIHPKQRDKTLHQMSLDVLKGLPTNNRSSLNKKLCNCIFATSHFENKLPINYHGWSVYIIAHGLENFTTEAKCLDFDYEQFGLKKFASRYFDKPLDKLDIDENLELLIRMKAPSLYEKYPERMTKRLNQLIQQRKNRVN